MLLRAARELAPPAMTIELFDLSVIPFYNADVEEHGDPESVATFKEAFRSSDGLLIATPEYQHGVSGVLKNALDWASRPPGQSPMQRKSAAILGATPGRLGTARAQTQLRESLAYTSTYTVLRPEVLVSHAHARFDRDRRLVDEPTRALLRELLFELQTLARALANRSTSDCIHAAA
jgi:chromate reductase